MITDNFLTITLTNLIPVSINLREIYKLILKNAIHHLERINQSWTSYYLSINAASFMPVQEAYQPSLILELQILVNWLYIQIHPYQVFFLRNIRFQWIGLNSFKKVFFLTTQYHKKKSGESGSSGSYESA